MSERDTVMIEVRSLKKYYPVGKNGVLKALDDVSFDIYRGEILGVVGESGCGKSTLGRCIMRLVDATGGTVAVDGMDLARLDRAQLKQLRRRMQMVFQNPFSSFNPKHNIERSLREVGKLFHMPAPQISARIAELLEVIGLDADVLTRMPPELSGGQLQRLAIARAMMTSPEFIMADEPVSALDVSVQAQVLNLILDLRARYHQTMMFISHDLPVVEHICDRVIVMYLGAVMELGRTPDLFDRTTHPYTMALLASKPKDHPDAEKPAFELTGDVPSALHMPAGCRFHPRCPYARKGLCDTTQPPLQEVGSGHFAACHLAAEIRSHAD